MIANDLILSELLLTKVPWNPLKLTTDISANMSVLWIIKLWPAGICTADSIKTRLISGKTMRQVKMLNYS